MLRVLALRVHACLSAFESAFVYVFVFFGVCLSVFEYVLVFLSVFVCVGLLFVLLPLHTQIRRNT